MHTHGLWQTYGPKNTSGAPPHWLHLAAGANVLIGTADPEVLVTTEEDTFVLDVRSVVLVLEAAADELVLVVLVDEAGFVEDVELLVDDEEEAFVLETTLLIELITTPPGPATEVVSEVSSIYTPLK